MHPRAATPNPRSCGCPCNRTRRDPTGLSLRQRPLFLNLLLAVVTSHACVAASTNTPSPPREATPSGALLIEAAGKVEISRAGSKEWLVHDLSTRLVPGDRLKTGSDSRATLLLSDRSVIRVGQHTIVLIQPSPPKPAKHRFRLNIGSLFFFDRETPRTVEFETPLATGAIRGTEFLLTVDPQDTSTRLALFDGQVDLNTDLGSLRLSTGDQVEVVPGAAPRRTALLNVVSQIQWALYYPAVLDPSELLLTPEEMRVLQPTLRAYREGDLIEALRVFPQAATPSVSPSASALLAALKLAVGNVPDAISLLDDLPTDHPARRALLTLIAAVRQDPLPASQPPASASESLAQSYYDQSRSKLDSALATARQAARQSPQFGFAHTRVAELELSFGRWPDALRSLERAAELSPRNPLVPVLQGFISLDQRRALPALAAFDEALRLDPALGLAWLGRGLASRQLGRDQDAETALQLAAALEPQRSVYRSSLARVYADGGDLSQAERELDLAKRLDPSDPTPWLYRALLDHQQNRLNDAIQHLERSRSLNHNQSVFRSRLLLDRDQAVRSADLAALYTDAGLTEIGLRSASRAVLEDYSGSAGHLFLANSYQQLDDANRVDLRLESARQSELLLANLLAPSGGGNLSQLLSQQDHLRLLEPRTVSFSSLTQYASRGDWLQAGSLFGTLGEFSYAVDTQYRDLQGDWENQDLQEFYLSAQARDQITLHDALYLQVGTLELESGDTARRRTPEEVNTDLRIEERQRPFVYAGWNHAWGPGSHTLLLGAYLEDRVDLVDPSLDLPFVRMSGDQPVGISSAPLFAYTSRSDYRLGSAELQQLWQTEQRTLIVGGRAQAGEILAQGQLSRTFTGPVADQRVAAAFSRLSAYAYHDWQLLEPFRFTVGLSYDHLEIPANVAPPPSQAARTPVNSGRPRPASSGPLPPAPSSGLPMRSPSEACTLTTASASNPPRSPAGTRLSVVSSRNPLPARSPEQGSKASERRSINHSPPTPTPDSMRLGSAPTAIAS